MKKNQYNKEGLKIGYWLGYYDNGVLSYKGNYRNGNKEGYWEVYNRNGTIWYKGYFIDDYRNSKFEFGLGELYKIEYYYK
jgi:antitoxin component YwqK of YwqJK toxin-antitoxin module